MARIWTAASAFPCTLFTVFKTNRLRKKIHQKGCKKEEEGEKTCVRFRKGVVHRPSLLADEQLNGAMENPGWEL